MVPVHLMATSSGAKPIPAQFRNAGAIEPGRAIAWAPANKAEEQQFRRLAEQGALVEMRPGTWYLNEEKLAAASGGARNVVLAIALALVAMAIWALLLG